MAVISKARAFHRILRREKLLDQLFQLAEETARSAGLTVVDARLCQQGKRRTLEVTIHRPGGRITIGDCETVSRSLGSRLDAISPPLIEGSYVLEVQSPGLERALKTARELEMFKGQLVKVFVNEKVDPFGATFIGVLAGMEGDRLTVINPRFDDAQAGRKRRSVAGLAIPDAVSLQKERISQIRLHWDPKSLDLDAGADTAPKADEVTAQVTAQECTTE